MADVETSIRALPAERLNVTDRLQAVARQLPAALAVICPQRWSPKYRSTKRGASDTAYATTTFAELDADASRIARGVAAWGVPQGTRLALLVRPGIDFVALVFGLLRAGMVIILVDPGLGRKNLIRCLSSAEPEGFVAISAAHAARQVFRNKFRRAKWNVTVGRRWFWGGLTLDQLRAMGAVGSASFGPSKALAEPVSYTTADDPAAMIFTSGSTGPPKGVLYTQQMFETQVAEIQSAYGIEPGGIDLACFPLFALFNAAMGVTTVFPEMDFSRPASASPKKLLSAANDWRVTQAFASPAVWRLLSDYCEQSGDRIETLRQVFSCGAPVPASVIRRTLAFVGEGAQMHTPYGMTEALPVATIEAAEVLGETAARTDAGAGVCVGHKFDSIEWRVIRITDEPIATMDDAEELPIGEIGELVVRGTQVSPVYVTRTNANATAKISERAGASSPPSGGAPLGGEDAPARDAGTSQSNWHRTGDVGYLDEQQRFWYCGRKSQRVRTRNGPLFPEKIEAVFNSLPGVRRSALVGIGNDDHQSPVIVVEPEERGLAQRNNITQRRQEELIRGWYDIEPRLEQLWYSEHGYMPLRAILFRTTMPVDIRHNAKINREQLAIWAATQIGPFASQPPAPSP